MKEFLRQSNPDSARPNPKTRVILVDDHSLFRDSLRAHLENQPDIEVVAEATNGEEAIKLAAELTPDVIIMDIAMPKMNGLEATRRIKIKYPEIIVLVLTVHTDSEYILKMLEAGADGYLSKTIHGDKLIHAVNLVASGESVLSSDVMGNLLKHVLLHPLKSPLPFIGEKLSARELEILRLAAMGMSNKQIAQELNLTLGTIKVHFVNILSKMDVNSRTQAVITGLRIGLLTSDDIGLNM